MFERRQINGFVLLLNTSQIASDREPLTFPVDFLHKIIVSTIYTIALIRGWTLSLSVTMIQFLLLFSKQAKPRLQKWFTSHPEKVKKKMFREVSTAVLSRGPKTCAFIEHKDLKLVYKRYASLYFCCGIGKCASQYSVFSHHNPSPRRWRWQWAAHSGDHSQLCWTSGSILRERLWAGHHLQLWEGGIRAVTLSLSHSLFPSGLLHSRRISAGWRNTGQLQEEHPQCYQASRFYPRGRDAAGIVWRRWSGLNWGNFVTEFPTTSSFFN